MPRNFRHNHTWGDYQRDRDQDAQADRIEAEHNTEETVMARKHAYRNGSKFGYQRSNGCSWLGYFEWREYNGITCWHWVWSLWANQNKTANDWIRGELLSFEAGLAT